MKLRVAVSVLVLVSVGWLATIEALQMRRQGQLKALAEPFVGVTTDGKTVPGLFEIRATGVSTEPVVEAARAFLHGLDDAVRCASSSP